MNYIPPTELTKIPKDIRDNYLEMSAELAVRQGLYAGQKTLSPEVREVFTDLLDNYLDFTNGCPICGCTHEEPEHGGFCVIGKMEKLLEADK